MAPRNRQGLYDPQDERDACGFGMVAQLDDQPSRLLVETAIAALSRMTHRGGVAADGITGDGCGLLLRRPDTFLNALAAEAGLSLGPRFAAGVVFLPHDAQAAQDAAGQDGTGGHRGLLAGAGRRAAPGDATPPRRRGPRIMRRHALPHATIGWLACRTQRRLNIGRLLPIAMR